MFKGDGVDLKVDLEMTKNTLEMLSVQIGIQSLITHRCFPFFPFFPFSNKESYGRGYEHW